MPTATDFQILLPSLLIWTLKVKNCSSQEDMLEYSTTEYYDNDSYYGYPELCNKSSNLQFRLWFMPTFFSIICFLGLSGNLLVILTFFYFKRLKTMTDVYLLNLAFADLLFALSLPFWGANAMADWKLGLFMCKAMHVIYKVSFYSSMLLLSCISVDRYFAITKALSAYRYRSKATFMSKLSSAIVWFLACIFSAPEIAYTTVSNDTCSSYSNSSYQVGVHVQTAQIMLGFVLPFLVMIFCYSTIVQTLCQGRSFERNRAIKVIFVVVAVFLFCQVPYNLVLFLSTLDMAWGGSKDCAYDNGLLFATDVTQCVAFLRCCLNPFVYAFIGVKFRKDLLRLLMDCGCVSPKLFSQLSNGRRKSLAPTDTETTTTFSP